MNRTIVFLSGILLSVLIWVAPATPLSLEFPKSPADIALHKTASDPIQSARYSIDDRQGQFTVKAFAGGLFSAFAHDHTIAIKSYDGRVEFTYGTVEPASLEIKVKAASLALTDRVSAADRQKIETTMRDEVLEVSSYPEIVFKSTSVSASKTGEGQYQARISGDLTLHGVTRPLVINARLEFGDKTLRAKGAFSIKQSAFSIKPVSVAGGTVKVKDELKFTFDVAAHA